MANPLKKLSDAREQARKAKDQLAEVVYITTVNSDGYPATRPVFSREITADGVCLYLSELSPKFRDLKKHPKVSLTFHWPGLERVFRITGDANVVKKSGMQAYWPKRHPMAKLLAHFYERVQPQSTPIKSRQVLEDGIKKLAVEFFQGDGIPLPKTWKCVLVKARTVEVWTSGGDSRLHTRELYQRKGKGWKRSLLVP